MNNIQKRIYIAGKISDIPQEEYTAKFDLACFRLQTMGFEPINPVDFCSDISSGRWVDYMDRCLKILPKCDGIYLLNDWADSNGASVEKMVADGIKEHFRPDFLILEQESAI